MFKFTLEKLNLEDLEKGICSGLKLGSSESSSIEEEDLKENHNIRGVKIKGSNGEKTLKSVRIGPRRHNLYTVTVKK